MGKIGWCAVLSPLLIFVCCGLPGSTASGGNGGGGGSGPATGSMSTSGGRSSTGPSSTSTAAGTGGAAGSGGGGTTVSAGGTGGRGGAGGTQGTGGGGACEPELQGVCCGTDYCNGNQNCCQLNGSFNCQGGPCPMNTKFDCDDSRDCGGELCCAHFNGSEWDSNFECMPACGGPGQFEICDIHHDNCAQGQCTPASMTLKGDHGYCL